MLVLECRRVPIHMLAIHLLYWLEIIRSMNGSEFQRISDHRGPSVLNAPTQRTPCDPCMVVRHFNLIGVHWFNNVCSASRHQILYMYFGIYFMYGSLNVNFFHTSIWNTSWIWRAILLLPVSNWNFSKIMNMQCFSLMHVSYCIFMISLM